MKELGRSGVIRIGAYEAKIPGPAGERGAPVGRRGTLDLRVNSLVPPNDWATHKQDEVYVVVRGEGVFHHNGRRDAFGPGDLLFVAADVPHRFEGFDKLVLWRMYYGVEGGEIPA
jgi:mannose-6-phosphate isomerase-like protein (cupin superfamily)